MINDLPTIFEVVTGTAKKQAKEKSSVSNHNGNKSKSGSKGVKYLLTSAFAYYYLFSLVVFQYHNCIVHCLYSSKASTLALSLL